MLWFAIDVGSKISALDLQKSPARLTAPEGGDRARRHIRCINVMEDILLLGCSFRCRSLEKGITADLPTYKVALLGFIENPGFSKEGGSTVDIVFMCVRVFLSRDEYNRELEKLSAARFRLAFEARSTWGSLIEAINLPLAESMDCPCECS